MVTEYVCWMMRNMSKQTILPTGQLTPTFVDQFYMVIESGEFDITANSVDLQRSSELRMNVRSRNPKRSNVSHLEFMLGRQSVHYRCSIFQNSCPMEHIAGQRRPGGDFETITGQSVSVVDKWKEVVKRLTCQQVTRSTNWLPKSGQTHRVSWNIEAICDQFMEHCIRLRDNMTELGYHFARSLVNISEAKRLEQLQVSPFLFETFKKRSRRSSACTGRRHRNVLTCNCFTLETR